MTTAAAANVKKVSNGGSGQFNRGQTSAIRSQNFSGKLKISLI